MGKQLALTTVFAALIFSLNSAAQAPHYEISGKIAGADGIQFVLQKFSNGRVVNFDTVTVTKGNFKITGGSVNYPEMVSFVTTDGKRGFSFYLENTKISVTGNIDSLNLAKVTGSKSTDEYYEFIRLYRPLNEKMNRLTNDYRATSASANTGNNGEPDEKMKKLNDDYMTASGAVIAEIKQLIKDFIKTYPSSFVSPMLLGSLVKDTPSAELEPLIKTMDQEVVKIPEMTALIAGIAARKVVEPGQKAPDFTLNNPDGKPVSLSSKVGARLLLIDFWAAWCGPCRRENPNVVKVYNEFHDKGFDVLGVSLDRERGQWLQAISDDKLIWTQVSDLQYFNSPVARLYNVNAIPSNFLLDDKGIIIAVNLRGEDLLTKVRELIERK